MSGRTGICITIIIIFLFTSCTSNKNDRIALAFLSAVNRADYEQANGWICKGSSTHSKTDQDAELTKLNSILNKYGMPPRSSWVIHYDKPSPTQLTRYYIPLHDVDSIELVFQKQVNDSIFWFIAKY